MIDVIESACSSAERSGVHESVFDLWQRVHEEQRPRGDSRLSPLLAVFGVSFVERALIDAHSPGRRPSVRGSGAGEHSWASASRHCMRSWPAASRGSSCPPGR